MFLHRQWPHKFANTIDAKRAFGAGVVSNASPGAMVQRLGVEMG